MTAIQSIARNIRDARDIGWRQRFLIATIFFVLMGASMLVISRMPTKYQAVADVLIVNGNERNDPTLSSVDLPSLVGSTVVLDRVRRELRISTPLSTMKRRLVAKAPAYRSGIMRIQYSDTDRERAATVANGIADELVRYYGELSTARYDKDLRALDDELSKQKKRLQHIDAQLTARGGAYVPSDDKDVAGSGNSLNALESQRALANAELQGDIAHAQAASSDMQRTILVDDPVYQQLQTSLSKALAQLADARARYTAEYPGLPTLQTRVDSLKAALTQEANRALASPGYLGPTAAMASSDQSKAQASVEADRAKVNALDEEVARQQQSLSVGSTLDTLRLARDETLRQYQSVAARRATSLADRADALSLGSVEVVSRAIPSEAQAGVGRVFLTFIASFLVAIVAFGIAWLVDHLDPRLRHVTQIEGLYGKPLMASLRASQPPKASLRNTKILNE